MNAIYNYFRSYFSTSFKTGYFLLIVLLLSGFIYFNYYWPQAFAQFFSGPSWTQEFIGNYLLYFIPFSLAFILQWFFYKRSLLKSTWLWTVIFLAPAFFSLRVNFDLQVYLLREWVPGIKPSLLQSINWIVRALVLLMLVYITWFINDRETMPFYGSDRLKNYTPYFILLLCIIPFIIWVGTRHDFLNMYPRANAVETIESPLKYLRLLLFELCYGFDFVSIEFFFRGFLIVGLINICGTRCIIPAACFYCCIHFGKPMVEAISSFFGGIILGIISYNTKSIWGGLVVHLGLAWLMELAGFLGHNLF